LGFFYEKLKNRFFRIFQIFLRKPSLNIKFSAFFYVTGPNQLNFEQKVQKKTVGRFGVIRS
jgi:hypothetical protein